MSNRCVKRLCELSVLGVFSVLALGCEGEAPEPGALEVVSEHYRANPEASGDTEKGCTIPRTDVASYVTLASGSWGSWSTCYEFCPADTLAYQVTAKSEKSQGTGDDSAMNGVALACYNKTTGGYQGYITSNQQAWGNWMDWVSASPYTVTNPFVGGKLMIEGSQGLGDDTAANMIMMYSANGVGVGPASYTWFGSWKTPAYCPAGTAVCGLSTRIEGSQGSGDDTALNGVAVACCYR
jgi:hypothetical protein